MAKYHESEVGDDEPFYWPDSKKVRADIHADVDPVLVAAMELESGLEGHYDEAAWDDAFYKLSTALYAAIAASKRCAELKEK
jgi:hypothetical protein